MTEQTDQHRRAKGRSPSYPGISLSTAVARARVLYEKEGRHAAPISAITGHWNYKSWTTGPASVTYAALIKFGLLEDEGSGKDRVAKLTPLALEIILKPDPQAAIRRAALLPTIHRQMWDDFGADLPSEDNLRYRLVVQQGFTETGFMEFIREYRETINYADLASSAVTVEQNTTDLAEEETHDRADDDAQHGDPPPPPPGGRPDDLKQRMTTPTTTNPAETEDDTGVSFGVVGVPMIGARQVTLEGQFPMTEQQWTHFMTVLGAMKPALVKQERE